jgi:hypothetical protein
MALVTFDHYTCKIISPSVVLDHRLDGEDLAWVRDHLRRCEACRERIEVFRERLLREEGLQTGLRVMPATPRVLVSVRRRASAYRERALDARRYAIVALVAVLVAGFFVSSGPRFAADAGKGAPISSTLLNTGATSPSTAPSPSAAAEPSASPGASQDHTAPTVVVASKHPTASPTSTPAPVAVAPPSVHLTVTPLSGLAPLTVIADASRSTSAIGIVSYEFDFGDGTHTPSMQSTFPHTYCPRGISSGSVTKYQLTVVVTDTAGRQSSASMSVEVTMPVPPVPC